MDSSETHKTATTTTTSTHHSSNNDIKIWISTHRVGSCLRCGYERGRHPPSQCESDPGAAKARVSRELLLHKCYYMRKKMAEARPRRRQSIPGKQNVRGRAEKDWASRKAQLLTTSTCATRIRRGPASDAMTSNDTQQRLRILKCSSGTTSTWQEQCETACFVAKLCSSLLSLL